MIQLYLFLALIAFEIYLVQNSNIANSIKNRKLYVFIFWQLFLILAFRSVYIFPDNESYAIHYTTFVDSSTPFYELNVLDRFGLGYQMYEKIIYVLSSGNFLWFNIITTLIILYSILHFFYKESQSFWVCITLFFLTRFFFDAMIATRETLALVIILSGYRLLKSERYILFSFCVMVACLFHRTAAVCFLFIAFWHYKEKGPLLVNVLIVFTVFIFASFEYILTTYIGLKDDSIYYNELSNGYNMIGLFNIITFVPVWYTVVKLKKFEKRSGASNFYYYITILNLMFCVLSIKLPIFRRFTMYFYPFIIIYLSKFYYEGHGRKYIINSFVVLLVITIFLLIYRPMYFINLPYDFYHYERFYYHPDL